MKIDKSIRAMPWPAPYKADNTRISFEVTVAQPVVGGHRQLVVTFNRNRANRRETWSGKEKNGDDFRLVCDKATGEVGALWKKTGKQVLKTLDQLIQSFGTASSYCYPEISEKDEAALVKWLGVKKQTRNHVMPELNVWTEDAVERVIQERRDARGELRDEDVHLCPEALPEGLVEYVRDTVVREDRALVYKRGNVQGTCYRCGANVKADPGHRFAQGRSATCPACGQPVLAYLEGSDYFGANYVEDVATIQLGTDGVTLFVRQWQTVRPKNPADLREKTASCLREVARYAVRGNKVAKWQHEGKESLYMHAYRYWMNDWERVTTLSQVYDGNYYFFLPPDWREIVAPTSLRYIDLEGYARKDGRVREVSNPIRFIMDWPRYPAIEKLWKAGYWRLVDDRIEGRVAPKQRGVIQWTSSTIREAMPFPVRFLKEAKPATWSFDMVRRTADLWGLVRAGKIAEREMKTLAGCPCPREFLADALGHATVEKIVAYMKRQYELEQEREQRQRRERENRVGDPAVFRATTAGVTYRDYLADCVRLGLDLDDKQVLFPRDLEAAHARTIAMVKYEENKAAREKFVKVVARLATLAWERDGLLIRPAETPDELTKEGAALHHCVGGYVERMANGETAIFFVRRVEEPTKPFFTLELRNDTVVQCRTANNASYTGDPAVEKFVTGWMQTVVMNKKAKKERSKKTTAVEAA